jgi:hypothetical protein
MLPFLYSILDEFMRWITAIEGGWLWNKRPRSLRSFVITVNRKQLIAVKDTGIVRFFSKGYIDSNEKTYLQPVVVWDN